MEEGTAIGRGARQMAEEQESMWNALSLLRGLNASPHTKTAERQKSCQVGVKLPKAIINPPYHHVFIQARVLSYIKVTLINGMNSTTSNY
jgi:hypothetical protein